METISFTVTRYRGKTDLRSVLHRSLRRLLAQIWSHGGKGLKKLNRASITHNAPSFERDGARSSLLVASFQDLGVVGRFAGTFRGG